MTKRRLNAEVALFSFAQASSFVMFMGINLSFFFFVQLFITVTRWQPAGLFRLTGRIKPLVLMFMVGAAGSTFHNLWEGDVTAFEYSLQVFPNYVYWGIMVLLFSMLAPLRMLDLSWIFRAVSWAVIIVVIYFVTLQDTLGSKLFLKEFGPNNLSFLLICFTPYLVYFLKQRFNPAVAIVILGLLLFLQLKEGRRAGVVLVLYGGMSALLIEWFKVNTIGPVMRLIIVALLGVALLSSEDVEQFILSNNDRVHDLIYTFSHDYVSNDRSFQVRQAMLEKGLNLFKEDVLFGAGLNNFGRIERFIVGWFEGSEYVMNKDIFLDVSSHNSYVNILAEGGLAMAVPFGGLMLVMLLAGLRRFGRMEDREKVVLLSFCVMCVHLWLMNAIVNSLAWFVIALLAYVVSQPEGRTASSRPEVPRCLDRRREWRRGGRRPGGEHPVLSTR